MKFKGWPKVSVKLDDGEVVEGIAPMLISASRSTDIPALYSSWFFHRLKCGYVRWVNPFNNKNSIISFEQTRLVVFWSKNPKPIIPFLHELDKYKINYFFHYTLNNYENEHLEPGIPCLSERISTFRQLSSLIGKNRVLWRFDPLVLIDSISVNNLLEKIRSVGEKIAPYTTRLTFSFLIPYTKVIRNMKKKGFAIENFENEIISQIGEGLQQMSNEWGIPVYSCAESRALDQYGISHGACIDPFYLADTFHNDSQICNFIGKSSEQNDLFNNSANLIHELKDPGQRKMCRCIVSKDIGRYDTCTHFCTYCYANRSEEQVSENSKSIKYTSDILL